MPTKTILIAVSGMSPAIITETVWALAQEAPQVIPDEVVIITTSRGERDIADMLLTPAPAWGGKTVWEQLRADVFLQAGLHSRQKKLQLTLRVIDLPDSTSGVRRPAEDLRVREDNVEAADFIVRVVDDCATDDIHVIASIAGGRKTMGALLYAAMSLRAKETDRVTHVLVSDPFETCRGFFYPKQPVQALTATPFGKPAVAVQASDAKIDMADLPFVPLRNKFVELREPRRTFAGLVECYACAEPSRPTTRPVVALDVGTATLVVNGRIIKLAGRQIAIAAFLMERALQGKPAIARQKDAVHLLNQFLGPWRTQHAKLPKIAAIAERLDAGDIARVFQDLRKKLTAKGLASSIPYLCPDRGRVAFEIAPA